MFGPCSGPRLDHEEFCALPPAEQVRTWRRLYGGEASLGHGQHFRFLDCIIENGCAGADAVVPLLRETQEPFLVEDAIHVVRFVHLRRCNLRSHEALEALREVERSQIDSDLRGKAREAIQLIETTVPLSPSEDAVHQER